MIRALAFLTLFFALPASGQSMSGGSAGRTQWDAIPNQLVVILDDVGSTALAAVSTPNIDAIATAGVTFSRAWAQALCVPSRAALITGLHGGHTDAHTPAVFDFDPQFYTLGTLLRYNSTGRVELGVFAKGPGVPTSGYISDAGITYANHHPSNLDIVGMSYLNWNNQLYTAPTSEARDETYALTPATGYSEVALSDQFFAWRDALPAGTPWIAWIGYHYPHAPFHDAANPGTTDGKTCPGAYTQEQCYDQMLVALDTEVGRLTAYLASHSLTSTTVVYVIGDNGSPTGIHGGGKGGFRDVDLRVPLIVAHGPVTATGTNTALVQIEDLTATILDYAEARSHPATFTTDATDSRFNGQPWFLDGRSIRCTLTPADCTGAWPWLSARQYSYIENPRSVADMTYVIDDAGMKLDTNHTTGYEELYDTVAGPTESLDLCGGDGVCTSGEMTGPQWTAYQSLVSARNNARANPPL